MSAANPNGEEKYINDAEALCIVENPNNKNLGNEKTWFNAAPIEYLIPLRLETKFFIMF